MKLLDTVFLFSGLMAFCEAAPANHLDERQGDKTYTITCLGPKCTDYPPTTLILPTSIPGVPGQPSKPVTTPKTTAKPPSSLTTKKTSSSSKYAPPTENPPTKTVKSTQKPTKTQTEVTGPSSTKCPVPLYYQCGGYYDGKPWTGCSKCVDGASCVLQNDFYYQCVADNQEIRSQGFAFRYRSKTR